MKKKYQCNTNLPACLLVQQIFAISVLLALCMQTAFAQSECVKNTHGILKCDLSISLIEKYSDASGMTMERAWYTTAAENMKISDQLKQFSEVWCELGLGKSRINKISILSGYKKSSADVALYNNIGRSYSYVGAYPKLKPNIVLYYAGFYDSKNIDRYLGRVLAHEFAHAALKVYDEYREFGVNSSKHCLNPLASDNPRATIMNNHISYTRLSHPVDYADTPSAQTAQYRCYGESAWEVLVQPERCDSNLSLDINAWFPRQDYFAQSPQCSSPVPSITELENPKAKNAVVNCINKTKEQLEINFLSGSENTIVVLDSGIDQAVKVFAGDAVKDTLNLLVAHDFAEDLLRETAELLRETEDPSDMKLMPRPPEHKYAVIDFHASDIPGAEDFLKTLHEQRREIDEILKNDPETHARLDDALNTVEQSFTGLLKRGDINSAVIISDTQTLPSTSAISFFKENGIPIHTIGIGDTVNPGLSMLSSETGGNYYTMSEQNPIDLGSILAQNYHSNIHYADGTITVDGPQILKLQVLPGAQQIVVYLLGDDNSRLDSVRYGRLRTFTTVSDSGPQTLFRTESDIGFIVNNPEAGVLDFLIEGEGSFGYITITIDSIDMSLSVGTEILPRKTEETAIVHPAPFPIRARVHGHMPILRATVKAELTTPNSNFDPVEIDLLDDGKSPDFRSGDGIYSGLMRDYSKYGDGIYNIKVIASNPDSLAVFDDTGIATFGTTRSEAHKAPPFRRVMYSQAEVKGTQTTLFNTNFSAPRDIGSDGILNWGIIKERGHTNWYRFRANNGGLHYIQSSNLLSHGPVQMATNMVLYEPNLNSGDPSFLAASVGYRGTNVSHIEHRLDEGKTYLISVSHANNARGVYGLTVNSENGILSSHEINRSINSNAGGGSIDYLLLAMLLMLLCTRSNFKLKIISSC